MASSISLAAIIEPQALKPAARPPRSINVTDLPELADLYVHAYADSTSTPDKDKAAGRISGAFDGIHGTPIPQASLMTADAKKPHHRCHRHYGTGTRKRWAQNRLHRRTFHPPRQPQGGPRRASAQPRPAGPPRPGPQNRGRDREQRQRCRHCVLPVPGLPPSQPGNSPD